MHCARPFQDCTSLCDRCATPTITIPPAMVDASRWRIALCVATIISFAVVATVAFAMPEIIERVNAAHMEDIL